MEFKETLVARIGAGELSVRPLLDHAAILHYDDVIGSPYRREAVRDEDGGEPLGQFHELVKEFSFGTDI